MNLTAVRDMLGCMAFANREGAHVDHGRYTSHIMLDGIIHHRMNRLVRRSVDGDAVMMGLVRCHLLILRDCREFQR
jgi:hypothetical protein